MSGQVTVRKTTNFKLNVGVSLNRNVDIDGNVGPIIITASIDTNRISAIPVIGPLGAVIGDVHTNDSLSFIIGDQIIVIHDDAYVAEFENMSDGVDYFNRMLFATITQQLNRMFRVNDGV